MKISIAIAAHAAAALLPESLASVAAQTSADWELLVVDHGPRDGTAALVSAFAADHPQVRYECLGETDVPALARNRLVELARGNAIALLEPGDAWLPRHLAIALQQLNTGRDVVVSDARIPGPAGESAFREIAAPAQLATSPVRTLFVQDALPCPSCVVVRRATLEAAGIFDPRFRAGDTRDMWMRCALNGARFALTQRSTCKRHVSAATSARVLQAAQAASQFYEKHRDLPQLPAALRRRLLARSLVTEGRLLRPVDSAQAARCFWRAWSLQPVQIQTLGQFALTGLARPPADMDSH